MSIYEKDYPCPRCLPLAFHGHIRPETIMPLQGGARDAQAIDGSGPCCVDCEAADTMIRLGMVPDFVMARVCTGNDRQERLRLPDLGHHYGLAKVGVMKEAMLFRTLEEHHNWLDSCGLPVVREKGVGRL